jgi:hypothetical protein
MPASRHQDHTLSPSVSQHHRLDVAYVHRIPPQRFVTTAKRPSYRAGIARISSDDLPDGERENACDMLARRANQVKSEKNVSRLHRHSRRRDRGEPGIYNQDRKRWIPDTRRGAFTQPRTASVHDRDSALVSRQIIRQRRLVDRARPAARREFLREGNPARRVHQGARTMRPHQSAFS